jgi:hypothetical protein
VAEPDHNCPFIAPFIAHSGRDSGGIQGGKLLLIYESLEPMEKVLHKLLDFPNAGDDGSGKHVHDRAAGFAARVGLNGDIAPATANAIMDSESIRESGCGGQKKNQEEDFHLARGRFGRPPFLPFSRLAAAFAGDVFFPPSRPSAWAWGFFSLCICGICFPLSA